MTKPPAVQTLTPQQRDRSICRIKKHAAAIKKARDGLREIQEEVEDWHGWAEQCHDELEIAIEKMSEYV
jgi:hypothetical protein